MAEVQQETLYTCPDCGSPAVDFSILSGGNGTCSACGWVGRKEDMLVVPLLHREGDKEATIMAIRNDVRQVYGRAAQDFGRFLVKWGFVDAVQRGGKIELNKAQFARFITAMAQASFMAVLNERRKMEEERVRGS